MLAKFRPAKKENTNPETYPAGHRSYDETPQYFCRAE